MIVSTFVRPLALLTAMAAAPAFGAEAVLLESRAPDSPAETAGEVKWTTSVGDDGRMVLKGYAVAGKGKLAAEIVFRRATEPAFASDFVIEVAFATGDDFEGETVDSLPGILVRMDIEQGVPLEGASARVVGSTFLFATTRNGNADVLLTGNWIDLAIVYETGQRAILGLGVDETVRDALVQMLP
jgi:hypothetical protein